ncbi:dead end protein 1 isoform X2 [Engraulis encrasicolus]|uniref:dead end protein 1 isoform X2 n=1 Tax=Engraulis encrasicolus TaxID=184585 RepID=UPI002FD6FE67
MGEQHLVKALEAWLQTTNTVLTQVNGQRRYGGPPPGWSGPTPGAGCEVFLCQLPREVYEDTLIPLCQTAGPLYEFRLMMNFSGQNRGFAYAKYATAGAAREAIRTLHRCTLPCGTSLVVRLSTEKHQLVLEGLPDDLDRPQLMKVLEELGQGMSGLTLKTALVGPQKQKHTTALVTYASHHAASMVKKVVVQAFKKQFGVSLAVSWTSSTALPGSPDRYDKPRGSGGAPHFPRRSSKLANRPPRLSPPSLPRPPPALPQTPSPLPPVSLPRRAPPGLSPNPTLPPMSPSTFLSPSPPPPQRRFSPAVGSVVGGRRPTYNGGSPMESVLQGGVGGEGGPTPTPTLEALLGGNNPVFFLHWLCESKGLGAPTYELMQQCTCADGSQLFLWKISIPGLPGSPSLPVVAHVASNPELGMSGLMSQAQSAAAMEVLPFLLNAPQV